MNRKLLLSIITSIAGFLILELLSVLKINILLGAQKSILTGFSIGGPLLGLYAGVGLGAGLFLLRRLFYSLAFGTSLISPFALYVPTLAATYYFKSTSWLIRVFVPILCMALFILHPIGGQAWFYTLYWVVPILLYTRNKPSVFGEALGATFVQHAVGSVMWIYLMPTTAALWTALVPIVAFERILCALGMVIVMQTICFIRTLPLQTLSASFPTRCSHLYNLVYHRKYNANNQ